MNPTFETYIFEEAGCESGVSKPLWNRMNALLKRMLVVDPNDRVSAMEIKQMFEVEYNSLMVYPQKSDDRISVGATGYETYDHAN